MLVISLFAERIYRGTIMIFMWEKQCYSGPEGIAVTGNQPPETSCFGCNLINWESKKTRCQTTQVLPRFSQYAPTENGCLGG